MLSRLEEAQKVIDSYDLGGRSFIHTKLYPIYFVIDVLKEEVFRNVILAMVAVFVCTELVLGNLVGCLIVTVTIFICLLSVCGYLYLIGLNLEPSSAMFITIAQGITVDYSAHIVHSFMKTPGTNREDRIKKSIVDIGPAVFNGGLSTFAGFFLCAFGKYPLTSMVFQIFSIVVSSGLFGAFLIIPVALSLFGPENIQNCRNDQIQRIEIAPANENHGFVKEENESKSGIDKDGTDVSNVTNVHELTEKVNSVLQDSDDSNENNANPNFNEASSAEIRRRYTPNKLSISTDRKDDRSQEMEILPPNYVPS